MPVIRNRTSPFWQIRFKRHGKTITESARTTSEAEAREYLRQRVSGELPPASSLDAAVLKWLRRLLKREGRSIGTIYREAEEHFKKRDVDELRAAVDECLTKANDFRRRLGNVWTSTSQMDEIIDGAVRAAQKLKRRSQQMMKLYRDEDVDRIQVCIETDAADEREFLDQLADAATEVIAAASTKAEQRDWYRRIIDIGCKIRGYKADVIERRVIQAGAIPPSDEALVADSREHANGKDESEEAAAH